MGSKLVLPETYTQFVKTLKWRREFDPRAAAMEKHDAVYDTVGYVCGKDKKGRLITYNLYGGLDNEAVRIPSHGDPHPPSRLIFLNNFLNSFPPISISYSPLMASLSSHLSSDTSHYFS
jgi:hypothetical protein